ncbi:MAG: acyl-CoA thioesterase [Micropepsaceae bacterium]
MKPAPFRLHRSTYPYFRRVIARFSDMDTEGHLNNVALASFYEDGRVSFLRGLTGNDKAFRFVIASISISYLAEAHYPGEYEVGLGVSRFGTKSFDIGCGLFIGDKCVGVCDTTQVTIGELAPIPIPAELENLLRKHLLSRID